MGARLVVDFGLVVLIWLVQLVVYPSFREVDAESFRRWHASYSSRVSFVVVPLMLAQLVLHARYVWEVRTGGAIAAALLVVGCWAWTFWVSVPLHGALSEGKSLDTIDRLIATNWARTAAWSLVFVLGLASRLRP